MGCVGAVRSIESSLWAVAASMWAVTGEDREQRQGTKTGNEDREPRQGTKTKNGEQRIIKEKDGETEREKA